MSDRTSLRVATADDLDALWQSEQAVFQRDAWSRQLLLDELTGDYRTYLVLLDEHGAVRGYGGVIVVGSEADIQTIAVDPELRGRGCGRALMNELLDIAAGGGAELIFLEVRADNPVARSLYGALGFVEMGVRPRYYQPDNVDAVVMRLEIKDRR